MTPEERANLALDSEEHYNRVMGSKIQVIGWSFYAAILWGLKVCITALYGRLTYDNLPFSAGSHESFLLTFGPQNWNLTSGDARESGLWDPWSQLLGRRSHHPLFMSAFQPLLASEP